MLIHTLTKPKYGNELGSAKQSTLCNVLSVSILIYLVGPNHEVWDLELHVFLFSLESYVRKWWLFCWIQGLIHFCHEYILKKIENVDNIHWASQSIGTGICQAMHSLQCTVCQHTYRLGWTKSWGTGSRTTRFLMKLGKLCEKILILLLNSRTYTFLS